MFIHCHSVHDYAALPPEAAYKWPLKRGGQGVGRAEWPGCWLWHSLTALSRSLFSHLFGVSRGSQIKRSMNKSRAQLLPSREIEMRNWGWMEVFLNVRMDLNKIWRATSGVVVLLFRPWIAIFLVVTPLIMMEMCSNILLTGEIHIFVGPDFY